MPLSALIPSSSTCWTCALFHFNSSIPLPICVYSFSYCLPPGTDPSLHWAFSVPQYSMVVCCDWYRIHTYISCSWHAYCILGNPVFTSLSPCSLDGTDLTPPPTAYCMDLANLISLHDCSGWLTGGQVTQIQRRVGLQILTWSIGKYRFIFGWGSGASCCNRRNPAKHKITFWGSRGKPWSQISGPFSHTDLLVLAVRPCKVTALCMNQGIFLFVSPHQCEFGFYHS